MLQLGHYWCRAESRGSEVSKETRVKVNGQRDLAYGSQMQKLCIATSDVTECSELSSVCAQMINQLVEGSNNNHKWRLVLTVAKKKKQGSRQGNRDQTRKLWCQFETDQWTLSVLILHEEMCKYI